MRHEPTFYETLEIDSTDAIAEIEHAHRRLSQQSHPDKVHHLAIEFPWVEQEAAQRFKRITEAFNVLSDDAARSRYDAELNQHWPDFVSRYAPPVCDPISHSRSAPEAPEKSSRIHTRAPQASAPKFETPPDSYFQKRAIPKASQLRGFEPRAENNRKNVFLSTFALIAMVTIIYVTSHYQLFDQTTSNRLMQQENNPNAVMHSTPAPDSASPFLLQPMNDAPARSPAPSSAKPKPLFPANQKQPTQKQP